MRSAKLNRKTKETDISCEINIDGTGQNEISTGIGFFNHMLEIFSHHSLIDLTLKARLKKIGEMDTELFHEFFKAFSNESKCNLHIENFYGDNNHHIIESCFKSFARSVRYALTIDERIKDIIPSSKGML